MELVVTKLAGSLAKELAGPARRKLTDLALGERDSRALEDVCRGALWRAVYEMEDDGVGRAELEHTLGLLERLVADVAPADIPSLITTESPDAPTLARWRRHARELGLDPETFPVPFDTVVARTLRLIPEELTRVAGRPDNPLFGQVVLARLEQLGANLAAVSMHDGLSRLVPLSAGLREVLSHPYEACRASGRAFVTPDLLLALASTEPVGSCLAAASPGLDARLVAQLREYLTTTDTGPFQPFDWDERADVLRARQLAWAAQVPAVTGLFMLRGVLDTPSNTRRQLAAWLGPVFDRLCDLARTRSRATATPSGTPGLIFPGPGGALD